MLGILGMMSDQYFDSRTLTPHATGVCPVRGCTAVLERPSNGKAYPLHCPDHKIKIHSRTFGYADPLRNIRFERAYFERNIRGNPHKAETHRLGYENSEDALTWNVFSRLSRTGRLADLMSNLAQIELKAQPDLYLWGLPIRLDAEERPEPFPTLVAARHQFERDIRKMHTEPDVMLLVPGRCLVLIEAKFMSDNTIAEHNAEDVANEKPKSQSGILLRYGVNGRPPTPLNTDHVCAPFFSQLYRNLVFATWMARQLEVEWRLVNLVSKLQHRERLDPTPFIHSVLPSACRNHFVLYDWERFYGEHIDGRADLEELADYLRYKSANCEQGLAI
jgi:hypothetical protein